MSDKRLFIATGNKDKVKEIKEKFAGINFTVLSPDDFEDMSLDVEETGSTLRENALLKARAGAEKSGLLTMADDTGLKVDALEGRPGVYSARFAGPEASYEENNRYLLEQLQGVPRDERTAHFVTVAALFDPQTGEEYTVKGMCKGIIEGELKGENGFGYDPLFYLPILDKTMAQLDTEIKNTISHRARALGKLKLVLDKNYSQKNYTE